MTTTPRSSRFLLLPDPRAPRGPHAANLRRFRLARIRVEPSTRPSLRPRRPAAETA